MLCFLDLQGLSKSIVLVYYIRLLLCVLILSYIGGHGKSSLLHALAGHMPRKQGASHFAARFTCFTSTRVRILIPEELAGVLTVDGEVGFCGHRSLTLALARSLSFSLSLSLPASLAFSVDGEVGSCGHTHTHTHTHTQVSHLLTCINFSICTQFTCFTGTKVQILTQMARHTACRSWLALRSARTSSSVSSSLRPHALVA